MKHFVTSGCSFSNNDGFRWPAKLGKILDFPVYNWGQDSCGNDWISRTIVHQVHQLIIKGINPTDIIVIPMWSGIDRKGLFVSKYDTWDFDRYFKKSLSTSPINFIDKNPNTILSANYKGGYIPGCLGPTIDDEYVSTQMNQFLQFRNNEFSAIESYENFLRVQWFCKSIGVTLMNLVYSDIFHFPTFKFLDAKKTGPLTKDLFKSIGNLYQLLDLNLWEFYDETGGLFEYTLNNNLTFEADLHHPSTSAHQHFVENFLVPALRQRNII